MIYSISIGCSIGFAYPWLGLVFFWFGLLGVLVLLMGDFLLSGLVFVSFICLVLYLLLLAFVYFFNFSLLLQLDRTLCLKFYRFFVRLCTSVDFFHSLYLGSDSGLSFLLVQFPSRSDIL